MDGESYGRLRLTPGCFRTDGPGQVDIVGILEELGGTRTTGIVRHIDELGRIVIPIEIRKRLGIAEKDPVEISVHGDTILLEKPRSVCVFCGSEEKLGEHRGRAVCRSCIRELARV